MPDARRSVSYDLHATPRPTAVPATYTIDPERHRIVLRMWGALTDADFRGSHERMSAEPSFDPHYQQLSEIDPGADVLVSSDTLLLIAGTSPFSPGVRRAVVAPDDAAFGIARMFAAYSAVSGQEVKVFRDRATAEAWLDG